MVHFRVLKFCAIIEQVAKLVLKLYKVCDLLEINLIKPIMAGRKKLEIKEVKLSRKESILIKIKAIVGEAGGTLISSG